MIDILDFIPSQIHDIDLYRDRECWQNKTHSSMFFMITLIIKLILILIIILEVIYALSFERHGFMISYNRRFYPQTKL